MNDNSMDVGVDQLIDVCRFLPNFLDKGTWKPANPLEDLVLRTLARGVALPTQRLSVSSKQTRRSKRRC
jgi:hypothetical protein